MWVRIAFLICGAVVKLLGLVIPNSFTLNFSYNPHLGTIQKALL